jgi:hypothetical protein
LTPVCGRTADTGKPDPAFSDQPPGEPGLGPERVGGLVQPVPLPLTVRLAQSPYLRETLSMAGTAGMIAATSLTGKLKQLTPRCVGVSSWLI